MATDERLERVFSLIQQGYDSKDSQEWWESSDAFCQAQELLKELYSAATAAATRTNDVEARKIAELYKTQSREYLKEAQGCFIKALQTNTGDDKESDPNELSDEEALSRIDLFAHLFSKPELSPQQVQAIGEQQTSLEERLMQLNASLPQGFKTSDERMRDINRGLNRLGLSLYSNADTNNKATGGAFTVSKLPLETNKSEAEQVAELISQAKDEVGLMATTGVDGPASIGINNSSSAYNNISDLPVESNKSEAEQVDEIIAQTKDELALMGIAGPLQERADKESAGPGVHVQGTPVDDEDSDVNSDVEKDNNDDKSISPQVVEEILERVVTVQASLAELVAMLNESNEPDDSSAANLIDRTSTRQSLKKARLELLQAMKLLVES